jgi:lycopene cyclase domain-containing protein
MGPDEVFQEKYKCHHFMKLTYLFIDLITVAIPFSFSFHRGIKFNKEFSAFFSANFISALSFIIWDVIFTAKGVWGFNEKFIIGINVYNLPLEEILFFICIPFACVFTYRYLNSKFRKGWNENVEKRMTILFISIFFIAGVWFWKRTYTATTFISFSLLLLLIRFIFQQGWIGSLYRAWLLLLLPFFIVNGILTGTGLSSPVVWYNDEEIIGIRILTIPVEDIIYGFELVMLTIFFYELFRSFFKASEENKVTLIVQR